MNLFLIQKKSIVFALINIQPTHRKEVAEMLPLFFVSDQNRSDRSADRFYLDKPKEIYPKIPLIIEQEFLLYLDKNS